MSLREERARRRRTRRIALAAFALAVLGPGRPIVLTALNESAPTDSHTVAERIRTAADDGPGTWTVDIDLVDETSQPRYESAADYGVPSASKRHALIVGINNARGGKPLPGSITDAKNVRDALLMYGFKSKNITMLLEQEASRAGILDGLEHLAQRTPDSGTAVFAIATHSRRVGGRNELLTADGLRISAYELASALGKVRGKMWIALPTCYAAGYALPGIVGKDRVATFASDANEEAYQLGGAGSFLIMTMVHDAMLERRAPSSVEDAFDYAERELRANYPERVPSMSDGVRESSSSATSRRYGRTATWRRWPDRTTIVPRTARTPRRRPGPLRLATRKGTAEKTHSRGRPPAVRTVGREDGSASAGRTAPAARGAARAALEDGPDEGGGHE